MAGTGVYWSHGEGELQQLAEELGIPVFLNGMGRGCLPADHDLCFSRARGQGLKEADVAVVAGVPLDFRLGFGASFGEETKIIWLDESQNELTANRKPEFELVGSIGVTLAALRTAAVSAGGSRERTASWVASLRETEDEKRAGETDELNDDRAPLHPLRIYGELAQMLDRDAIVIGDGGDFVSYAGRVVNTYEPGCWMDPAPTAASAPAPARRSAPRPPSPTARSSACSATAPSASPASSSTRWCATTSRSSASSATTGSGRSSTTRCGSSTATRWRLRLRPATRYDEVVKALGGHGELVRHPSELRAGVGAGV